MNFRLDFDLTKFIFVIALGGLLFLLGACEGSPALPTPTYDVTIRVDNTERRIDTATKTVGAILDSASISLGPLDRVTPPEVTTISDGMIITVTRVIQKTERVTSTIPYKREIVRDATVPEGVSRLLQSGREGIRARQYQVTIEDGKVVDRVLVSESAVEEPQDEVRLLGTKPELQAVTISGTLAYLSNQDAWLIRESNLERRRLTHFGDLDGRVFALSHDRTRLLFTRAVTEEQSLNELWFVSTTEADPTPISLEVTDILWGDWSPNNRTIAWTQAEVVSEAPGWRGLNDLWVADLTNKDTFADRRQVLEPEAGGGYGWWGTRYAWGPDDTLLAFARPDSVGVVELQSGVRNSLLSFPPYRSYSSWAWNPTPSWSPDGEFLVFTTHAGGPSEDEPEESPIFNLVVLSSSRHYSAELALEVGMWSAPQFAPEGDRVLFGRAMIPYQSATSLYTLHTVDRDGSNQVALRFEDTVELDRPQWTWGPDGRSVAYLQFGDVYWCSLPSCKPVPLTDEGNVRQIVWR
jgi:hypothetical protein